MADPPKSADSAKPESTSSLDAIGHGIQKTIVDAMFAAFTSQTVQIPGSEYAELGVAMSATDALAKRSTAKKSRTTYSP
ncbi:transposase-like protein [Corynebacterium diphtheriae str. Aberdeen]|nr:transposase-like protein [Corynebacterium diphtheriae str. Aberdeen]